MDTFEALFPRDASACETGKLWYVCTIGSFRGCCSTDPCTSGVCPENEDDPTTTSATSSSDLELTTAGAVNRLPNVTPRTTTTSSVTTLTEAVTVSSDDPTSTMSASPTSRTSASSSSSKLSTATNTSTYPVVAATDAAASPSTTPTGSSSTASSNRGAIIGGVVGGLAALALIALLVFCCLRQRKTQRHYGRRSTSLSWWYPYGRVQKDQAAGSEMKEPQSYDSEASSKQVPASFRGHSNNATGSLTASSTVSPSNTGVTSGIHLTPNLVLTSSSTNLISFSPQKHQLPPTPQLSTELFASVPRRQHSTPELPDTGFPRPRAELASNQQSEWINIPINQRRQTPIRTRIGPRAWESPALTPIAASPRESPIRETRVDAGHTRSQSDGCNAPEPRQVITADGVVLGANLDRYSNGLEIARSLDQHRGGGTEHAGTDHVMSFMHFGGSEGGVGLSLRGPSGGSTSRDRERSDMDRTVVGDLEDVEGDVPPAYEANDGSLQPEIKSPSGRMEMSLRGV
ncbi:uncharacterized protein N7506_004862 [Penicillium brevicompactum]|uniref:uncharacterized protein n=1 Tax=Penicillium brevicompactum TaxID=5074 RepID=UPI00253F76C5|nr:uncharacterized protein N7506_004862 [Penicillium brevicompactum]KAJ5336840.1 hypothetical protein N7506_004862 [Penicillium brevicompactum]